VCTALCGWLYDFAPEVSVSEQEPVAFGGREHDDAVAVQVADAAQLAEDAP
jgi:hypothetical protein